MPRTEVSREKSVRGFTFTFSGGTYETKSHFYYYFMHSMPVRDRFLFSQCFPGSRSLPKKTFQIHNTYDQSVTSLTCYEDKEGNVLLPLTDILTPAGFTVEECPRCGKDEVYSKENENNNGLGHYFVNWYQKLLSYSVSDKTLSLSAANEKVGGKTYCPKDAFEYMGVSVTIDTKALTVTVSDKKIRGIYFYSSTCDSCEKIDNFLDTIDEKYPDCRISRYDIYDTANYDLLQEYGKVYHVPDEKKGFTPSLYISDKVLIGAEIQAELEQAVRDYEKGPATKILLADETTQTTTPVSGSKAAQIFSALGAGLINGLNPCSLSIFLFLLFPFAGRSEIYASQRLRFHSGKNPHVFPSRNPFIQCDPLRQYQTDLCLAECIYDCFRPSFRRVKLMGFFHGKKRKFWQHETAAPQSATQEKRRSSQVGRRPPHCQIKRTSAIFHWHDRSHRRIFMHRSDLLILRGDPGSKRKCRLIPGFIASLIQHRFRDPADCFNACTLYQ